MRHDFFMVSIIKRTEEDQIKIIDMDAKTNANDTNYMKKVTRNELETSSSDAH